MSAQAPASAEVEFCVSDFFEHHEVWVDGDPRGHKRVLVAIRSMTKQQAVQAYPYRQHQGGRSRWGTKDGEFDVPYVFANKAKRCEMCRAVTLIELLLKGVCPDCDGRAEYLGYDPHAPM